jgi:hypothetical protein
MNPNLVSSQAPNWGSRVLAWASWLSLVLAVLAAATALFSQWGVNAESFGARDMGLALNFAFVGGVILVGSLYAVPVLVVLGVLTLFVQRHSGYRFMAAAAVTALPLAVLTLLD